ncbi:FUSC family protein [Paraburkholderia solisilvae]|uniref:Inner membrane protein YeeA n=1 Tax=Paraburkholderia solisilvae TaxID=624376 RepID=A0A6J5EGF0_9BURK|nr:FUSC family protein [Paraburkholderia solisilvae]CAB3764794.1 Inner membrane protein YeeA [Paraburkholderia solisilvae]
MALDDSKHAPGGPAIAQGARRRSSVARLLRTLTSPYYRYRNAKVLHGLRVGIAMLVSIVLIYATDVPHGIWASITVLIVIGGLQHHGNIRRKALERTIGTLLGAALGLALIVQHTLFGSFVATALLMSAVAAICGSFAIGAYGYMALLTAITMCIVGGFGDNQVADGLWRAADVAIGTVIALAFSFALPLHATYTWRYLLSDNLRECARIYTRMAHGDWLSAEEQNAAFLRMGRRLVQLRAVMPWVAKEIEVAPGRLDQIQQLHRMLLSALEIMSNGVLTRGDAALRAGFAGQCGRDASAVRAVLLDLARALRFTNMPHFRMPDALPPALLDPAAFAGAAAELQGPCWLNERVAEQVERLRALLVETEPGWNIERRTRVAHRHEHQEQH